MIKNGFFILLLISILIIGITGCTSTYKEFISKKDLNSEKLSKAEEVFVTLNSDTILVLSGVVVEDEKLKGETTTGRVRELEMSDVKTIEVRKTGSSDLGNLLFLIGGFILFIGIIGGISYASAES